ncbi:MAG: Unknown protein [uncultured Campylobacterales bacterium]|uniref:Polymer-forming cytoskeletal protein n=1 Tax=uncultured Campylobacterales bacterium TaxID=352960 RepID=A0A6S6SS63_9BACT|nr:MAG: Unknown protein [uncultured Campylobacterales bacterium]
MGKLNKKNKTRLSSDTTVISEAAVLDGDISIEGNINIYGNVTGNLSSNGTIIIGECANVVGNVKAEKLYISGRLKGDIDAHSVEILQGGVFIGNIKSDNLSIETGAVFEGASLGSASTDS